VARTIRTQAFSLRKLDERAVAVPKIPRKLFTGGVARKEIKARVTTSVGKDRFITFDDIDGAANVV